MSKRMGYSIDFNSAFGPLEVVDVPALAEAVEERRWHNQTLVGVDACVVRLGVTQGELVGRAPGKKLARRTLRHNAAEPYAPRKGGDESRERRV